MTNKAQPHFEGRGEGRGSTDTWSVFVGFKKNKKQNKLRTTNPKVKWPGTQILARSKPSRVCMVAGKGQTQPALHPD